MRMKVQRDPHKRSWEHDESETHNHRFEDEAAGDEYLGFDVSMDITTGNEQGVQ